MSTGSAGPATYGVNCTGSCSWKVFVKNGIITWENQQIDYPSCGADMPEFEPRGCPRGATFSNPHDFLGFTLSGKGIPPICRRQGGRYNGDSRPVSEKRSSAPSAFRAGRTTVEKVSVMIKKVQLPL